MKKTIGMTLMAMAMMLCVASCYTDDNPVGGGGSDSTVGDKFTPEVIVGIAPLYVAPGVDADLSQAFSWAADFHASTPEDGGILVLNKLTDVSEEVLKRALSGEDANSFLICVVNPVKSEFDAYAESHDWFHLDTYNVNDALFIYGFNADNRHYQIYKKPAEAEGTPVDISYNRAEDYYVQISAMLIDFQRNYTAADKESTDQKNRMEDFASSFHDMAIVYFNSDYTFRKVAFSDPDVLKGSGYLSASYDVYMVHVYEGEPGAGDYYGVNMRASVASANMWKGKGRNKHGGVYVRWVGAYCKEFSVESRLLTKADEAHWDEDLSSRIIFPAGASPSPSTTNGQETYKETNSFGLSTSLSVGGKSGHNDRGDYAENSGQLAVSANWQWSQTHERTIKDVNIANNSKNNWPSWKLIFDNLPEFAWSQQYGFDIKSNEASRNTMDLETVWMWYDKSGKDNDDRAPYVLGTCLSATYGAQSFITTYADHKEDTWSFSEKRYIYLPKMVNVTAGKLTIKNNMSNGATISNIKVFTSEGTQVSEYPNTVPNGGEQELGAYDTRHTYTVKFKARTTDGKEHLYAYTLNPSISLNHKSPTSVYAASDFTEVAN